MPKSDNYDDFVAKFAPKKTTDDCYTPAIVYEAVKSFAVERYNLKGRTIVRPFFPGGDYENYPYSDTDVVIDNPPFSILTKIADFYVQKGIKFFLFSPTLTIFSVLSTRPISAIVTNAQITYENGAKVNTSFITNLEPHACVMTSSELSEELSKANSNLENRKLIPKYVYPSEVLTISLITRYARNKQDVCLKKENLHFIRVLDSQKEAKKTLFGGGYLIGDSIKQKINVEELKKTEEPKENRSNKEPIVWQLSEREKEIIKSL